MIGRKLGILGVVVLGAAACGMAMIGADTPLSLQKGVTASRAVGQNPPAAPEQARPAAGRPDSFNGAPAGAAAARAGGVAYVSSTGGEPWGMMGNVNALNDVFGAGNWTRLDFPTAVGNGLWGYDMIVLDGGDGATLEFIDFVNANRADMEAWTGAGGSLIIGAARWDDYSDFDLGFGMTLIYSGGSDGWADDVTHPVFDGPWGATGDYFYGSGLYHDHIAGAGFTSLMTGDNGQPILTERSFGSGHVIAHGLTLPFFGESSAWSENCWAMHRNLFAYAHDMIGGGEEELKYVQPFSCDEYMYFSNMNSNNPPYDWMRYDDFICTQTGDITKIVFWGGGWDVFSFEGCDLFQNLAAVQIDIYEWLPGGQCDWQHGALLCSNTIPLNQLEPAFECIGPNGTEEYYRFTANLPEPCYQEEGEHYVLMIAGVLIDPNNPCIFGWVNTPEDYNSLAYSHKPLTDEWICGGPDQAFELYTAPAGPVKYVQPPNCDDYVWFSNVNSNVNPWIRMDDFVCNQTGNIETIVFWGNGFDVDQWQECGLANIPQFLIEIYQWIPEGPCDWMPGQLLCSYQIPTEDLAPVYECTGPNGDYFKFTANLPEPCYQEEGEHYVLLIGGVLANPDDPCIFGWLPTPMIHWSVAASYDLWNDDWYCGDVDQSFALYTEGGDCIIDQNQPNAFSYMAAFSQTDLAQSFKQDHDSICGAGIHLYTAGNPGRVTISVWDALPNQGGTMLASGSDIGTPGNWIDVFWPTVSITAGQTYYLVFEDDNTGMGIYGDTNNPYPHGHVFANAGFQPYPNYDYTFRTYYDTGMQNTCPWDFDGNDVVNTADLLHLLGCWGTPCGDVDGDGDTDTADLLALLAHWGDCP